MDGYLICFGITYILAYMAEKLLKDNKKIGKLFLFLSLFVVCFVAGVRNTNVGKDVGVYVKGLIKWFNEENIIVNPIVSEPLFNLLVYITNKIGNINFVLFAIEVCIAGPIYYWAYKNKDRFSISFIILVFLMTMFARSLNLMRQCIAISFLLLSVYFYEKNDKKLCIIFYIIAISFHYTAVIGFLCFVVQNILKNEKSTTKEKIIQFISILIVIILGLLFFENIVKLLPVKYSGYLNSSHANLNNVISFSSLLKKFFWIIIGLIVYFSTTKRDNVLLLSVIYLLIDLLLFFSSIKIKPAGRLGYYFLYIGYLNFFPIFIKKFKQKKVITFLVTIVLFVLWYHMTVVNFKADATYPYTSTFVKFLN